MVSTVPPSRCDEMAFGGSFLGLLGYLMGKQSLTIHWRWAFVKLCKLIIITSFVRNLKTGLDVELKTFSCVKYLNNITFVALFAKIGPQIGSSLSYSLCGIIQGSPATLQQLSQTFMLRFICTACHSCH